MLALALSASLLAAPLVPGDHCNARDVKRTPWTAEAKARSRARVQAVLEELEVGASVRAYHDAIVYRESFGGEAGVRHLLGSETAEEDGLGTHGLSLYWHRDKWPGDDEEPAFCSPEVSTVVAHEIMWRAVERYGARNLVEIQSVYAGAVVCIDPPDPWAWVERVSSPLAAWLRRVPWVSPAPERECLFTLTEDRVSKLCGRMRSRGVSCWATVTAEDLGGRLPLGERRAWALSRARRAARG